MVGLTLLILFVLINVVAFRLPSTHNPYGWIKGIYWTGYSLIRANRLSEAKHVFEDALRLQNKYESTWYFHVLRNGESEGIAELPISDALMAIDGGSISPDELPVLLATQSESSIHYMIYEDGPVKTIANYFDDGTLLVVFSDGSESQIVFWNCQECYDELVEAAANADFQYLDNVVSEHVTHLEYFYITAGGERINGWWEAGSSEEVPPWASFSAEVTAVAEQALLNGEVITIGEYMEKLLEKEAIYGSGSITDSYWSEEYFKITHMLSEHDAF